MRAEVFRSKGGDWRFRLIAKNNEPVAQSEGYRDRQSALDTVALITDEQIERVDVIEDEEVG